MGIYNFSEIEAKCQLYWEQNQIYKVSEDPSKEPCYILDMFPYPSGAGLHVGHPLGYIASDVLSRYKRHKGFNVLHPMGFDAFGLPAEQYAIETGNAPDTFTYQNIERYRKQLKSIGLSFDWSREVITCDPNYYKWTQWIFIQLYNSWYDKVEGKARPITDLVAILDSGNAGTIKAHGWDDFELIQRVWPEVSHEGKLEILSKVRLAYQGETTEWWCEALGTILAADEVIDGRSERGGYPCEQRKIKSWLLRITAYADRLLSGLDGLDWSDAIKDQQRNWIGKSKGAHIKFPIYLFDPAQGDYVEQNEVLEVFTTRPDTLFGVSFLVIAPEHPLTLVLGVRAYSITAGDFGAERTLKNLEEYITQTASRSVRDRQVEVKTVTGVPTGASVKHPFTGVYIPLWTASYVLAGYGTGVIMAVPAHDERDYHFAQHFRLQIPEVVKPLNQGDEKVELPFVEKDGELIHSGFLNGLHVKDAIERCVVELESHGYGKATTTYRLRDANFSRQRYWGEPIPILYDEVGNAIEVDEEVLPVMLPKTEVYTPPQGKLTVLESIPDWVNPSPGVHREPNTMPGWAGSSWYYLRYMDPHNKDEAVSKAKADYWKGSVDYYVGGSEHAVGHLLYARFWHKFLNDIGVVSGEEPFKKLINQGMIQGTSALVKRLKGGESMFMSADDVSAFDFDYLHVPVSMVAGDVLDTEAFKLWRPDLAQAQFLPSEENFKVSFQVEKMSKRWHNVVTPDEVIAKHGCDAFRIYEMFLGPIEASKPWNTESIDGVSRFLRKVHNLFYDDTNTIKATHTQANKEELKALHKALGKVGDDLERLSMNTCISALMILTNELTTLGTISREVLEPFALLLSPFAPHLAEQLWQDLGHSETIVYAPWPIFNPQHVVEDAFEYPVSINGKLRTKLTMPTNATATEVEAEVRKLDLDKWTEGKPLKKVIIVPNRIVNIVI